MVKEQYHDDMTRRHDELRIKNNMDCKKINKILQEVKAIREKLRLLNVRPSQRSVSTQISTTTGGANTVSSLVRYSPISVLITILACAGLDPVHYLVFVLIM